MKQTWLTPAEAASYLGLAVSTLANWRSAGTGPKFARQGRVIRYRPIDLDRYLEDAKGSPAVTERKHPSEAALDAAGEQLAQMELRLAERDAGIRA